LAATLAASTPAGAAVVEFASGLPAPSAPAALSMPGAIDLHLQALTALTAQPAWIPSVSAYLQANIAAAPSAPIQAAAARFVAEALTRPALFSALPENPALEERVKEMHAKPEGREALLQAIAPLRAQDDAELPPSRRLDAWRAAFDGAGQKYEPFVHNFPGMRYAYGDPAAIKAGRTYYVASTSGNAPDAGPIVKSKDLKTWTLAGFLFPEGKRPAWHDDHPDTYDFWAPEIHKIGRKFFAYYTARDRTGRLCIGAASAARVEGPWTDLGRPLIRDERVGLIDSHHFFDPVSGKHLLYWKKDGNDLSPREKTTFYARELSPDGLSLIGPRHEVLENDQEWEADVVEGAWVTYRNGWYYAFYSGNDYTTNRYALGVARSRSPFGPFEKNPRRLLSTGAAATGPGHNSIVKGPDGKDLLVYHAYEPGGGGYRKKRVMRIEPIEWIGGWPRVGNGFPGGAPPLR
jgi:GH43 family beta-xylosidase